MSNSTVAKHDEDLKKAIYTPAEVAQFGRQGIDDYKKNAARGMGIGIAGIQDYFAPLMPGQICAIIGQTSHYKSGLMHHIEHQAAGDLAEQGRTDEILIHVSVEECIEEQAYMEFARYSGEDPGAIARGNVQDWGKLESAVTRVAGIPIFRIGDSLARAEFEPHLYMSNMIRSIRHLVEGDVLDWKPKVAGLFFDYLQAFPIDPEIAKSTSRDNQRRLQVRSDFYRLRKASKYFKCPVWVAVQAKQKLDGAHPPIMLPGVYDGEETSSIGQRADRVLTTWMPARTNLVGAYIDLGKDSFTVDNDMLWIKVAKQRGGYPAGKAWRCRVDFSHNFISPEK